MRSVMANMDDEVKAIQMKAAEIQAQQEITSPDPVASAE